MDEHDVMLGLLTGEQRVRFNQSLPALAPRGIRTLEELRLVKDHTKTYRELAQANDGSRGQAEKNRKSRLEADEGLVGKVAELVNRREVNKTIATKLKIGLHRVKRLRATAKARGLLARRRR